MYYEDDKEMLLQLVSVGPTKSTYAHEAMLRTSLAALTLSTPHQSRADHRHHIGAVPINSKLNG